MRTDKIGLLYVEHIMRDGKPRTIPEIQQALLARFDIERHRHTLASDFACLTHIYDLKIERVGRNQVYYSLAHLDVEG